MPGLQASKWATGSSTQQAAKTASKNGLNSSKWAAQGDNTLKSGGLGASKWAQQQTEKTAPKADNTSKGGLGASKWAQQADKAASRDDMTPSKGGLGASKWAQEDNKAPSKGGLGASKWAQEDVVVPPPQQPQRQTLSEKLDSINTSIKTPGYSVSAGTITSPEGGAEKAKVGMRASKYAS